MGRNGKYDFDLDMQHENALSKILRQITPKSTVLEFGPANGRMTQYMQRKLDCQVYIVEIDEHAAKDASQYAVDSLIADIEKFAWQERWKDVSFDFITFADVLEHLHDPKQVLLHARELLKDDGKILLSVPNVANNALLLNLYQDNFAYTDVGLLDRTHIHLFAYQNLEKMCHDADLVPVCRDAVYSGVGENEVAASYSDVSAHVRSVLQSREKGDIYQYVYTLQKEDWVRKNEIPVENRLKKCQGGYVIRVFIKADGAETQKDYSYSVEDTLSFRLDLSQYADIEQIYIAFLNVNGWAKATLSIETSDGCIYPLDLHSCSDSLVVWGNAQYLLAGDSLRICIPADRLAQASALCMDATFLAANISSGAAEAARQYITILDRAQTEVAAVHGQYDAIREQAAAQQTTSERIFAELEEVRAQHAAQQALLEDLSIRYNALCEHYAVQNKLTEDLLSQHDDLIAQQAAHQDALLSLMSQHDNLPILTEQIANIQHTANDILYVSQNSGWYMRAMRRIQRGPSLPQRIAAAPKRLLTAVSDALYRAAKRSPSFYRFARQVYSLGVSVSPSMRSRLDHVVWNSKHTVDQIPAEVSGMISNEVEQCDLALPQNAPLVTVIVPNYNHEPYLRQRLDSIYGQTYQNYEVLLLDDCSTDNSRDILQEYAQKYPEKTRCIFNEKNTGRANLQWNKGMENARGQYIWIAESDDWCEPNFLETLVPLLDQQSVMIAFARSVFMTDGQKTWSTEEYLHDLPLSWDKPFTMTGFRAVQNGFAVKNFIPNASSAVFRNIGKIPNEVMDIWNNIRLVGDWVFYLYLVKGGAFSYTNATTNYYRIHKGSTSLNVQRTAAYYQEAEIVSCYIARNYRVAHTVFENTLKVLQQHYLENKYGTDPEDVKQWYHLDAIRAAAEQRIPNIMICNFSMKMGGGEILPIHLANALRKLGAPVTFLDCRMEEYDEKVRAMLNPGVPLVELRTPLALQIAAKAFGPEIVHSHHGSVDKLVSELLRGYGCHQVITLHGMYEAIDKADLADLLRNVVSTCSVFAYIADKNLVPFREYGYFDYCRFVKIGNGLVSGCPAPVDRAALNIPADAFVLCLVSRARLDKGWLEGAQAVMQANQSSKRPIHLVLVGDGEAYEKIKQVDSPFVHAVGAQQNPRAYFAMADMGFLPSYFAGESFPLVVIESLMCGKPVLASRIGEIPQQLELSDGRAAGVMFDLVDRKVPVETLSALIADLANDAEKYHALSAAVPDAAARFDIDTVAKQYLDIYKTAMEIRS